MRIVAIVSILLGWLAGPAVAEPPQTYAFEEIAWTTPVAEAERALARGGFSRLPESESLYVRAREDRTVTATMTADGSGALVGITVEIDFHGRSVEETVARRRTVTDELRRSLGRPEEIDDAGNPVGEILWPRARDGSLFEVSWNADVDLRLHYRVGAEGYE